MGYPNQFAPNGFSPVNLEGIKSPIRMRRPVVANRNPTGSASTAILSVGDAYTLDANGNALHAGPNDVVYGIVDLIELEAVPTIMNANGPVSVDQVMQPYSAFIIGIEDSKVFFETQADNFNPPNIGQLYNLNDTVAPSTLFRQSRQYIATGAAGTQFRAMDIAYRPTDNAYGANARVIVRLAQVPAIN